MSPETKHGTTTGYRNGCRCARCRRACADAMAGRRRRSYLQRTDTLSVPAYRVHRRVQALVAIGWSLAEISARAGYTRSHAALVLRRRAPMQQPTAARFFALYEELSMQSPPETTRAEKIDASRARNMAARKGWLPPLAYVDIDDPDEHPDLTATDDEPDPVVIDRILAGDRTLRPTKAERWEVIRRWPGTDAELERIFGWNVARERREMRAAEGVAA